MAPPVDDARAAVLFNLGYSYEHGEGVAQDSTEAVRYYRLAAEQGHADAQFSLGCCYGQGAGVAQDWAEAVRY
jgi:TPR repeat protein